MEEYSQLDEDHENILFTSLDSNSGDKISVDEDVKIKETQQLDWRISSQQERVREVSRLSWEANLWIIL